MTTQIVEIGLELTTEEELKVIEAFLDKMMVPYYIEPPCNWTSLADLEAACEDK